MIKTLKQHDIETNLGAQAINCLAYYKDKYGWSDADFPNAAMAYKQGLALPMGRHLSGEDIGYIVDILTQLVKI